MINNHLTLDTSVTTDEISRHLANSKTDAIVRNFMKSHPEMTIATRAAVAERWGTYDCPKITFRVVLWKSKDGARETTYRAGAWTSDECMPLVTAANGVLKRKPLLLVATRKFQSASDLKSCRGGTRAAFVDW